MATVTKGASKAKRIVGTKSLKKEKEAAHRRNRRNVKNKIQKEGNEVELPVSDAPELTDWDVA